MGAEELCQFLILSYGLLGIIKSLGRKTPNLGCENARKGYFKDNYCIVFFDLFAFLFLLANKCS
jgi:hypothetical protein